jgi:hypothetical protein
MIGALVFGYVPMGDAHNLAPESGWGNQCPSKGEGWNQQLKGDALWGNSDAKSSIWNQQIEVDGSWDKSDAKTSFWNQQQRNSVNTNKCE